MSNFEEDARLSFSSPELADGSLEVPAPPREENLAGIVLVPVEIEFFALEKLIELMLDLGNLLGIDGMGVGAATEE